MSDSSPSENTVEPVKLVEETSSETKYVKKIKYLPYFNSKIYEKSCNPIDNWKHDINDKLNNMDIILKIQEKFRAFEYCCLNLNLPQNKQIINELLSLLNPSLEVMPDMFSILIHNEEHLMKYFQIMSGMNGMNDMNGMSDMNDIDGNRNASSEDMNVMNVMNVKGIKTKSLFLEYMYQGKFNSSKIANVLNMNDTNQIIYCKFNQMFTFDKMVSFIESLPYEDFISTIKSISSNFKELKYEGPIPLEYSDVDFTGSIKALFMNSHIKKLISEKYQFIGEIFNKSSKYFTDCTFKYLKDDIINVENNECSFEIFDIQVKLPLKYYLMTKIGYISESIDINLIINGMSIFQILYRLGFIIQLGTLLEKYLNVTTITTPTNVINNKDYFDNVLLNDVLSEKCDAFTSDTCNNCLFDNDSDCNCPKNNIYINNIVNKICSYSDINLSSPDTTLLLFKHYLKTKKPKYFSNKILKEQKNNIKYESIELEKLFKSHSRQEEKPIENNEVNDKINKYNEDIYKIFMKSLKQIPFDEKIFTYILFENPSSGMTYQNRSEFLSSNYSSIIPVSNYIDKHNIISNNKRKEIIEEYCNNSFTKFNYNCILDLLNNKKKSIKESNDFTKYADYVFFTELISTVEKLIKSRSSWW
jgi:hypothetical protein